MPFKLKGDIELQISEESKERLKEDMATLLGEGDEFALNRMFSFEDSFEKLHDEFAIVIDDMLNLENQSQSMVTAVSASFGALTGTLGAVGVAWQEMLLTGELSWKAFGQAMKAMVAEELAAISASALVNALYSTAIGFIRLAQMNFAAAGAAFTAAAGFAAVAVIAGAGAVAMARSAGAGAGGEGFDDFGPEPDRTDEVEKANQKRYMHLEIHGSLLGQEEYLREEFIPQLNSLVMEDDAVLITSKRENTSRNVRG